MTEKKTAPPPDIWDACRTAQDAAALRKAREAERERAAAQLLGFTQNTEGQWTRRCTGCGSVLTLRTNTRGGLLMDADDPKCGTRNPLQQWLDTEFQND